MKIKIIIAMLIFLQGCTTAMDKMNKTLDKYNDFSIVPKSVRCNDISPFNPHDYTAWWPDRSDNLPNGCMVYAAAARAKLIKAGVVAKVLGVRLLNGETHSVTIYPIEGKLFCYDYNTGSKMIGNATTAKTSLDIAEMIYPQYSIRRAYWVNEIPE